jgi:predicted glycoside hydrolase/deacetylase ChbG (UPF0249 family)
MTKLVGVCADDFGLAPGISAGIVRLASARRITAIACIANSPYWEGDAALLAGLPADIDVGLHLNLTEGRPLSRRLTRLWRRMPSLPKLILLAHLGRLPRAELRREVHAQFAAFLAAYGKPPRFIDGHQHVHHLPGLREIVLDVVDHVQPVPAMRSTGQLSGPGFAFKRWLIERTGGRALAGALHGRAMEHNRVLLGAYDFATADYRALMQGWLEAAPEKGALLFCHPGEHHAGDPPDAIGAARERELAYLAGEGFASDLARAGVQLGNVWR